MANLPILDGNGDKKWLKKEATGTEVDPHYDTSELTLESIDQNITSLVSATTLNSVNTEILSDFVIPQNSSISNFIQLRGRAFLLRIPADMQGDTLFIRVRFSSGVEERLRDTDNNLLSVIYTSTQSIIAIPFLTDVIGSHIALEAATGLTATNQNAARTLQLKVLM